MLVLGKGKGKGKGPPYGKGVNGIKGSDGKGLLQGPGKGKATGGRLSTLFAAFVSHPLPTDLVFFIRFTGPRHRWLSQAVKARRPEPGCRRQMFSSFVASIVLARHPFSAFRKYPSFRAFVIQLKSIRSRFYCFENESFIRGLFLGESKHFSAQSMMRYKD